MVDHERTSETKHWVICVLVATAGGALIAATTVGCESATETERCPTSEPKSAQAIVNGTSVESFLDLDKEDLQAIVPISTGVWPTGSLCTGVLVRPGWVLTAAHCLVMKDPVIEVRSLDGTVNDSRVSEAFPHPELDVALLAIAPTLENEVLYAVRPMSLGFDAERITWIGQRVELAGWGQTELGELDGLRVAVESVTELGDTKIRVNGLGRSGACDGDSGGPLLIRGSDGRPMVAGILSTGSASCVGRDSYIRADLFSDWVTSIAGPDSAPPLSCGTIGREGRCLYNIALNCVDGKLVADPCYGGRICGWDSLSRQFGCVSPSNDHCRGQGSAGGCIDETALTCNAGMLQVTRCAPCGTCRYSPTTGRPECIAAE